MASKQEILDYIMHTPGNTNPNVLGSMLEDNSDENTQYVGFHLMSAGGVTGIVRDSDNRPLTPALLQTHITNNDIVVIKDSNTLQQSSTWTTSNNNLTLEVFNMSFYAKDINSAYSGE